MEDLAEGNAPSTVMEYVCQACYTVCSCCTENQEEKRGVAYHKPPPKGLPLEGLPCSEVVSIVELPDKAEEGKPVDVDMEVLPDKAKDVETSPPEAPQNEGAMGLLQPTAAPRERTYFERGCQFCKKICCFNQELEQDEDEVLNMQDFKVKPKDAETTTPGPSRSESDVQPNDTPPTQRATTPPTTRTPSRTSSTSQDPITRSSTVDTFDSVADDKSKESGISGKSSSVDDTEDTKL